MPRRVGFSSSFFLLVTVFFWAVITATSAGARQKPIEQRPMDFVLVLNGDCTKVCTQWISAEGMITADAPRKFKALLKSLNGRALPIVLQSSGGDVRAALTIGRMIRKAGLETAIGRTQLNDCPMIDPRCSSKIVKGGWSEGEVHGGGAYCFSACPFILAGGVASRAATTADIGLHQMTNGRKSKEYGTPGRRNLNAISTNNDPNLKQELFDYLHEMGAMPNNIFDIMGLAMPQEMYRVRNAEALKVGLITKFFAYSEEPGYMFHCERFEKTWQSCELR